MSGRWRVRRVAKWGGLGVCCLILTAWGLTVNLAGGLNLGVTHDGSHNHLELRYGGVVSRTSTGRENRRISRGWEIHRFRANRLVWWQGFGLHLPAIHLWSYGSFVYIPLWALFCLVGAPTAVLFYRDRRRPKPGHCRKCGYDLTGNVSGVCPECGRACEVDGREM